MIGSPWFTVNILEYRIFISRFGTGMVTVVVTEGSLSCIY